MNEAAAAAADHGALTPLHVCVPGRARVKVAGLRRSLRIKQLLEEGLAALSSVRHVEASIDTGNILVLFDPDTTLATILEQLAMLLRDELGLPGEFDGSRHSSAHWHRLEPEQVAERLGSSLERGLEHAAARQLLARAGRNEVRAMSDRSHLSMLAVQFQSPPVALLAGTAGIAFATGRFLEAAAIAVVVILNAVIGYVTESRAERTIRSLGPQGARAHPVMREGSLREVPASSIVPGDVIVLGRGSVVPADARVISARALTVSEAPLTGESLPVAKTARRLPQPRVPLRERRNMVYRGTIVTGGTGRAIVVATGAQTEVGRVQRLVQASRPPETPLYRQLARLGRQLLVVTLGASLLLFMIGRLRGFALLHMARLALSLAVSAVPEGLPMIATTSHAFAVDKMRRREIHVRRLDAIETLASTSVVCFDKTGTLTHNRMSVAEIDVAGSIHRAQRGRFADPHGGRLGAIRSLLEVGCLCTEIDLAEEREAAGVVGSGTEAALIEAARLNGVDPLAAQRAFPRLSIQERTETYRFMVTTHAAGEGILIAVKGSPDEVLARCATEEGSDGRLAAERRQEIDRANRRMALQGLRVLGFARAECAAEAADDVLARGLTWVGLAGLADPVRPGVRELMARLHRAGVQTIMLTGDQRATARAVADEIGLTRAQGPPTIFDSSDVESLKPAELASRARATDVFARVSPAQKLRIVRALQQSGAVVAMIGDGINDGPALRAADVGLAIGQNGDAAAREVADVFLATDALEKFAEAIEQGRADHANIRKSLRFILGTNTSEVLLTLASTATRLVETLSPLQLLWINVISDVLPGIGLTLEEPESDVMSTEPRDPDAAIAGSADIAMLASEGAMLAAGPFAAGLFGMLRHGSVAAETRTMTFGSLVIGQLLHALTCRSKVHSVFGPHAPSSNATLNAILGGTLLAQVAAAVTPGIRDLLGIAPLGAAETAVTLAGGVWPFLAGQLLNARRARQQPTRSSLVFVRDQESPGEAAAAAR